MTVIVVLRILTLLARAALATQFLLVLFRTYRSGSRKRAWFIVGASTLIVLLTGGMGELLHWRVVGDRALIGTDALFYSIYYLGYLANAAVSAVVPLLLAAVLTASNRIRVTASVLTIAVAVFTARGVTSGMVQEWHGLMGAARVLDFVAIAAHLSVWALVALRKAEIDIYLAGFLGVETLFLLVLPVQEVFFQAAGRAGSQHMWELHQLLQLATCATQLAIVTTVYKLVSRGSVLPRLRLGGVL